MAASNDFYLVPVTARFLCPGGVSQRYAGHQRDTLVMDAEKTVKFALYDAGFAAEDYRLKMIGHAVDSTLTENSSPPCGLSTGHQDPCC